MCLSMPHRLRFALQRRTFLPAYAPDIFSARDN
jgi:hypothetical protein